MSFRYWLLTIPFNLFTPYLPPGCAFITGQLECGAQTNYLHWQVLASFKKRVSLKHVKDTFGHEIHAEATRSAAADDYVCKDDTAIIGTRFALGQRPLKRNDPTDWAMIKSKAMIGDFDNIPPDILIRHFGNLKKLRSDYISPRFRENIIANFYYGATGTGKTQSSWNEARLVSNMRHPERTGENTGTPTGEHGECLDIYVKDPNTKWWDGYRGQRYIIIDEFTGLISIGHLLRWLDKYPCTVETKGSTVEFCGTDFWITSNLSLEECYPTITGEQMKALKRRLKIKKFISYF